MEASLYSRPKPSPLMEVSASKYHFRIDLTIDFPGPLPPENSGAHRYVFLLYTQPTSFAPQGDLATPGQPIATFDVNQYATVSPSPTVLTLTESNGLTYSVRLGEWTRSYRRGMYTSNHSKNSKNSSISVGHLLHLRARYGRPTYHHLCNQHRDAPGGSEFWGSEFWGS